MTRCLPPSDPSFILQFEYVRGVEVEGRRGSGLGAAELRVAAVADREILQSSVNEQIDKRRGGQVAVRDEIALEKVEDNADRDADDDDGQTHLGVEVLTAV